MNRTGLAVVVAASMLVAAGLAGYAVVELREGERDDDVDEESSVVTPASERVAPAEPLVKIARVLRPADESRAFWRESDVLAVEGVDEDLNAIAGDQAFGAEDAVRSFRGMLQRLDGIAVERKRLSESEWEEIYATTNAAFAGLSRHLDPNEPDDRKMLESAHREMVSKLAKLKKRVRKKKRTR